MFAGKRIGLLVLAAALLIVMSACAVPGGAVAAEQETLQTAPVRQGDITISATGAGSVVPASQIVFGFDGSGTLTSLLVSVGDEVKAGEALARLDDTAAQKELAAAELSLAAAVMQTDASATETGTSYGDLAVEQAFLALESAQSALDELLDWMPEDDDIAKAQAALKAAQASYNAALGQESASGGTITVQMINLEQAQRALAEAEAAYVTAFDPGREWELFIDDPSCKTGEQFPNCTGTPISDNIEKEREAAESAVQRAEDNLVIAEANYNSAVSGTNYSGSASASSNLLAAELALDAVQEGPSEAEIGAAKTAVRQAELSYQTALLNREQAQNIGLAQAQLALEGAQQAVEDMTLTAPIAGTIMAIAADVGELAPGGSLITLADLSQPLLEVYLDETDQDKVQVGYEVEIEFDAFPDEVFTGTVKQVEPQLSVVNGVTTVRALVEPDVSSFSKPQTLAVGMNATVEIVGGRAANALLVPVEALRESSPGGYVVFVVGDTGEPELRVVEVGLVDYSFAEILSGLEMGETVTTGLVATQ